MSTTPIRSSDAADVRGLIDATTSALAELSAVVYQVPTAELGALLSQLRTLAGVADAASVTVTAEAQSRGETGYAGTSPAARTCCRAWVADHSPVGADPVVAFRIGTLATICNRAEYDVLGDAVRSGQLGLVAGSLALREYETLAKKLHDDVQVEALGWFVAVARGGDLNQVRQLRPQILATYGDELELQREQNHLHEGRYLSRPQDVDGMCAYTLLLDPEGSAVFEAALDLPSAPSDPDHAGGTDGTNSGANDAGGVRLPLGLRDLRSAGQRRADALLTLIGRAVTGTEQQPGQPGAQIVVTIDDNTLREQVRGAGTVLGRLEPTVLTTTTVRKLACDAHILPMILGTRSEPLDVGRTKRLVTTAMSKALWLRDRGCTYPGCHAPPAWTDAHHIKHWADGGTTSLNNLALLCGHHHTLVHRKALTATIDHTGVHWNV